MIYNKTPVAKELKFKYLQHASNSFLNEQFPDEWETLDRTEGDIETFIENNACEHLDDTCSIEVSDLITSSAWDLQSFCEPELKADAIKLIRYHMKEHGIEVSDLT
jgi:antitoxin component HigA of HigAB toxin-antitoxin module